MKNSTMLPQVKLKNSIATKLLKVVFSIYFLVTLTVTAIHMIGEYFYVQDSIRKEMITLKNSFAPGLANSLYNVDIEQIQVTMDGILKIPSIVGLKIIESIDNEEYALGYIIDKNNKVVLAGSENKGNGPQKNFFKLFWIESDLNIDGEKVGSIKLYSNAKVVFNRVQLGFFFIIVNSIIKTLALWIIFYLAMKKLLGKPLTQLTMATEQISFNNLADSNIQIDTSDGNELKILEAAFNSMTKKLYLSNTAMQEAQNSLQQSHNELENRVAERTAQLSTSNQRLEKLVIKTEQLALEAKHAAQAKSDFLANMSHEIRTPMNGVITAADLAMDLDSSPKIKRYLNIIQTSGHSLLGIINDILDFSKIEAGKLILENKDFSLNQLFQEVSTLFASKMAEKEINFILDLDMTVPHFVMGDMLRIKQIITNLVGNAIKFTEHGGIIKIGATNKNLTDTSVTVEFFVKDSGIGMSQEYQKNLFDPFTQADTSTTRKYGGTGLGLTISKQLVEMMHGKIWVESEASKGSCFFFTVEFALPPQKMRIEYEITEDIYGYKVLVIDDCVECQNALEKMLKFLKFQVQCIDSGQEAVALLEKQQAENNKFDLIITDWMMSKMNGIETIRKIRQELKLNIPIIMLTGFGNDNERIKAEHAGANFFLTKPVQAITLSNAIMTVFGKTDIEDDPNQDHISNQSQNNKNHLKGLRVLLAEDNLTNQEIAVAVLNNAQMKVEIANNGLEAVDLVQQQKFDVILMDMQMPEMDGYEAAKTIRKDTRYDSIPIIAMTAHAMKGDREKCMAAGMDGYVSKPINQKELFKIMSELIKPRELSVSELTFLKQNENIISKIEDAIKSQNFKQLAQLSTALKDDAETINEIRIQNIAKQLIKQQQQQKPINKALLTSLDYEIKSVLDKIKAHTYLPHKGLWP